MGLITLRIFDSPYDRFNWRRVRVILELHRYIVLQRVGSGEVEVTATLRLFCNFVLHTRLTHNNNAKSDTYVDIGSTVGVHHPTTVKTEIRFLADVFFTTDPNLDLHRGRALYQWGVPNVVRQRIFFFLRCDHPYDIFIEVTTTFYAFRTTFKLPCGRTYSVAVNEA